MMGEWELIETAPKDGTALILSVEIRPDDWRIKVGGWRRTKPSIGSGWIIFGASWTPTHWMPLPEPPKENKYND